MEDEKIIDLYFSRDEAALSATAEKYGSYLKSIARGVLNNPSDAEECVNDAYLAAWQTIPPQRPNGLKAFLGKIVRNISLDRCDYNNAAKRSAEFEVMLSELENVASAVPTPEEELEGRLIAGQISSFLRKIEPRSRNIFIRRYWYGDSLSEIAARFGIGEGKIASQLFRTRNKLKKYLEKEGTVL